MTGVATAIAIGTLVTGAVVAHDIKVKKNRAEGAIKEQARTLQEQIDQQLEDQTKEPEGPVASVREDQDRRRRNLRRINPTGSRGVRDDEGLGGSFRQANMNYSGGSQAQSFPSGRSRLLGS